MESISVNLELTASQTEQLRSTLGTEYNIAEVLAAWGTKRLHEEGNLGNILKSFKTEELETLRFQEFKILLTEDIRTQANKWPNIHIDEIAYEALKKLTKRNPESEFLSQTEVDEMLMDLVPGSHSNGPSGIFSCKKVFSGSNANTELVAVQVLIRANLLKEIEAMAHNQGIESAEKLIHQTILGFSPVKQI